MTTHLHCVWHKTYSFFIFSGTHLINLCKTAQSVQTAGKCSECTFHFCSEFLIQNNFTPSDTHDSVWRTNTIGQCFQLIGYRVVGKRTGDRFYLCIITTTSSAHHRVSTCVCTEHVTVSNGLGAPGLSLRLLSSHDYLLVIATPYVCITPYKIDTDTDLALRNFKYNSKMQCGRRKSGAG